MKKKLIIVFLILLVLFIFYLVDNKRVKNDKTPIFAIKTGAYKDGGSTEYYGFLYKVIKCNTLSGDKSAHIGYYNLDIDKVCINSYMNITYLGSSNESDYLFSYKNSIQELLYLLELNMYGKFNYEIKNNTLKINYYDVEGWGNIIEKETILMEKSTLLFALIDDVYKIEWTASNNSKVINMSDINKTYKNIKYYTHSSGTLNELLKLLGYVENPVSLELISINNDSLSFKIINNTDKRFLWGQGYRIEEYVNNKWHNVNLEINVNSIGYILDSNKETDNNINSIKYLSNGKYRIIKDFREIISENDNGFEFGKLYYSFLEFEIK